MKQELYISNSLCTSCDEYHESIIRCKGEVEEIKFGFCVYLGQTIVDEIVECSARDTYEKYLHKKNKEEMAE